MIITINILLIFQLILFTMQSSQFPISFTAESKCLCMPTVNRYLRTSHKNRTQQLLMLLAVIKYNYINNNIAMDYKLRFTWKPL